MTSAEVSRAQQNSLGCSNDCPPPPTPTPTITPFGNPSATAASTATATPTTTRTATRSFTPTAAFTPTSVPFDCNHDGVVGVLDIERIVEILNHCAACAGSGAPASGCDAVSGDDKQCTAADVAKDGCLTAADLNRAVASVLDE